MKTRWLAAVLVAGLVGVVGTARAQTTVSGGDFRRWQLEDTSLLQRGRWEYGINVAGVYVSNTTTPTMGDAISQTTFYANPGFVLGRMFTDRVEIRLLLSYLRILTQTTIGDMDPITTQDSHNFLGGVQGLYHVPLPLGFAFYAGVGGLGYVGRTIRPTGMGTFLHDGTRGGGGQLLVGLLSQPGPQLTMRGGLRFDALFGSETLEGMSDTESTRNFELLLEFEIAFRS